MSLSNYWENEILDHIFDKGSYSAPAIYVALSKADPGEDGSGLSEPSGGSYARVGTSAVNWNTASGGSIDNADKFEFPKATADWGTITHVALYDSSSGGNLLFYCSLDLGVTVNTDCTASFAAGDLEFSLD